MKIVQRHTIKHTLPQEMHPVIRRIYSGRGIASLQDLDYALENLLSFNAIRNIDAAVDVLVKAIGDNKKILIIADYDADGATACALAIRGLSQLGATHVDFLVPDRVRHGYGLSTDVARLALEFDPDLIITVDNGIASIEGVKYVRAAGVDVLITDHHLPGDELPEATVIINPNQQGDTFPSKCIAGVGVMFYVLLAVRSRLRELGWFEDKAISLPNFAHMLDLVALGTIADVVELDLNNRILVAQGLRRINSRICSPGMLALIHVANRVPEKVTSTDLGFALAPRLNAAGRLDDMSLGIACLLTDDFSHALSLAQRLDTLNQERKRIQRDMQAEAEALLDEAQPLQHNALPMGICLYDDKWHQGVIGVLAGRVKDRLNRPVFIFARDDDGLLKGSGRSLSGIHLKDVLDALARENPQLIEKFGGHAMAAGLTIKQQHYALFKTLFNDEITRLTRRQPIGDDIETDGELAADQFSLGLAREIENAGPWGQGFAEPLFNGRFSVADVRVVAGRHLKFKLQAANSEQLIDAISFYSSDDVRVKEADSLELIYQLCVNDYNGHPSPQLIIKHLAPC